jgi:hypothetical protein
MGAGLLLGIATLLMGCVGTTTAKRQSTELTDPVLGMLNRGIVSLTVNIERAGKRMEELKQFPDTQEPLIQELRAMDLLALELHQRQWILQRHHLQFAKAQMLAVRQHPTEKTRLLEEWTAHERQYEQDLETFRQKRLELEQKRLKAEAQLIEASLR